MRDFLPRQPQQLAAVVAQNVADLVVDLEDPGVRRGDRHADQSEVEVPVKALVAAA